LFPPIKKEKTLTFFEDLLSQYNIEIPEKLKTENQEIELYKFTYKMLSQEIVKKFLNRISKDYKDCDKFILNNVWKNGVYKSNNQSTEILQPNFEHFSNDVTDLNIILNNNYESISNNLYSMLINTENTPIKLFNTILHLNSYYNLNEIIATIVCMIDLEKINIEIKEENNEIIQTIKTGSELYRLCFENNPQEFAFFKEIYQTKYETRYNNLVEYAIDIDRKKGTNRYSQFIYNVYDNKISDFKNNYFESNAFILGMRSIDIDEIELDNLNNNQIEEKKYIKKSL